ncbi:hypothetical protein DL237_06630 [Pseudooceanicola sediminis]|uniref:Amidoligase enzyme n=1 Tax=Pseudooceanicola sediminis TaxID=2211117 RepID=A0A399J1Q8_9RHOB|nr:amidoligase family protein [Pseudooceanicola sediminis]KAA2314729.1 hypothetical protein E0K93_10505 [Puniceibacterium sp. HSS470]RII39318.1 hypothetical protein DL237_06630 [Pseudooceanicola sediminis]|tara:strand:+ start:163205 stop:164200 length:996 start_codon:yes stop_codon:yes gene_type:complete
MDTRTHQTSPLSLPTPTDAGGQPRKLGVEVEFGGLGEEKTASLLARETGGTMECQGTDYTVSDTPFGTCKMFIDTAYRKRASGEIAKTALDLARGLVPVELVTDPFDPVALPKLDTLLATMRDAGAYGTERGILLGFGVHLNVQTASDDVAHLWSVVTAFALAEPLLRHNHPIDLSRRVLPFVDPYPRALLDALAEGPPETLHDLAQIYLTYAPSRNHALDMLPIIADFDTSLIREVFGDNHGIGARPAFHYRMPDCRIDDPEWSVSQEWDLWVAIEALAEDHAALNALCAAWRDHRDRLARIPHGWLDRAAEILRDYGHDSLSKRDSAAA